MWIKPTNDVTIRTRRRATSVPADVGIRVSRYDVGGGVAAANQANVIAKYANEDSDAIAAASRRNDRDFLYAVSAKMANLNSNTNYVPPPRSSSSRSVSPNVRQRPPPPPPVAAPASTYLRRAAALTPDDNYDIAAYLQRTPSSPSSGYRHGVAGRSTSLPPGGLHQSHPSVPRWFPTSVNYYGRAAGGGSAGPYRGGRAVPLPVGLPPRLPTGERLDAITDSVVGVAHTSLYGDIVIGIPYKKRYMYNVQPGVPELVQPYSRASYAGPSSAGLGPGYRPLASHRRGAYPSGASSSAAAAADRDDVISIKSYPGAFVGGRSVTRTNRRPLPGFDAHRVDDLENDIDLNDFDDSGALGRLSSLKKDAKSILNRYALQPAPVSTSNGPKHLSTSELDARYGQILSSMQAQNRIPPKTDYAAPTLPPYPSTPKRPPMSDTRKRLRELLCRSRNDPHYYD